MATRNILDKDSNVIGTLTLDDDTTETEWSNALHCYTLPAVIPDVTPRQMRQAMCLNGISTADIDAAINSFPEPIKTLARDEWEYSIAFQRNRPLVAQIGTLIGWNASQIDDLWKFAASL